MRYQISGGSEWGWWATTSKMFVLHSIIEDLGMIGCVFALFGIRAFLTSNNGVGRWIASGPIAYAVGVSLIMDELTGRLFIPLSAFLPILAARGLIDVYEFIAMKAPDGWREVTRPGCLFIAMLTLSVGIHGTLIEGVRGTSVREFTDEGPVWVNADGKGSHDWFDAFRDDQGYAYEALIEYPDFDNSDVVLHQDRIMAAEYLGVSTHHLYSHTNGSFDCDGKQNSPWNQSTVAGVFNGSIIPDERSDTIWFVASKGELWHEMNVTWQNNLFENYTIRYESERAYVFSRNPLPDAIDIT